MEAFIDVFQVFMVRDNDFGFTKLLAKYVDDLVMVTRSESMLDELCEVLIKLWKSEIGSNIPVQ